MFEFEGIVIRVTPFRDNDAMVNVLSKDCFRSFLARGVLKYKSKNAPSTNLFSKSRFQVSKTKEGYSLRSGELLCSYPNIKNNISVLAVCDLIGELTNKLLQNDDASHLYEWLEKAFDLINSGFDPLTVGLIYFANILKESGYSLNVDSCVICGQTSQITAVSYNDGGFICSDCYRPSKHAKCTSRKLKIIRYIFKVSPSDMSKISFSKEECLEIINELNHFLYNNVQIDLKSITLLNNI